MIILTEPEPRFLDSYRSACAEYRQTGIRDYVFTDPDSCDIFKKFDDYHSARNLKPGRVGSDYYWLVDIDTDTFLGEVAIRHELNDALRFCGGHIGYGIRCGNWNKGYGTTMLTLALEKARQRGLTRVLVTCDDTNIASARVMEKNGFLQEKKVEFSEDGEKRIIRHYWKTI